MTANETDATNDTIEQLRKELAFHTQEEYPWVHEEEVHPDPVKAAEGELDIANDLHKPAVIALKIMVEAAHIRSGDMEFNAPQLQDYHPYTTGFEKVLDVRFAGWARGSGDRLFVKMFRVEIAGQERYFGYLKDKKDNEEEDVVVAPYPTNKAERDMGRIQDNIEDELNEQDVGRYETLPNVYTNDLDLEVPRLDD